MHYPETRINGLTAQTCVSPVLREGLGNRLFQLAAAYGYARRYYKQCVLRDVRNNTHSPDDFTSNLLRHFPRVDREPVLRYAERFEDHLRYLPVPYVEADIEINGCFQTEKHLGPFRQDFLDLLCFPEQAIAGRLPYEETLFLHGRRGDRLTTPHLNVPMETYYQRALDLATRNVAPGATLAVFSDDLNYFRNWSTLARFESHFKRVVFVDEANPLLAITMMSACRLGSIWPNSTFSWWAAFINMHADKFVTFPDKWDQAGRICEIQFTGSHKLPV